MKINDFHEIRDFRDRPHLRHSCRVVQSAEISFFQEKTYFFLRNKNMSRIVSDVVRGVGAPWDHSKSSKFMIFDKNQWKRGSSRGKRFRSDVEWEITPTHHQNRFWQRKSTFLIILKLYRKSSCWKSWKFSYFGAFFWKYMKSLWNPYQILGFSLPNAWILTRIS